LGVGNNFRTDARDLFLGEVCFHRLHRATFCSCSSDCNRSYCVSKCISETCSTYHAVIHHGYPLRIYLTEKPAPRPGSASDPLIPDFGGFGLALGCPTPINISMLLSLAGSYHGLFSIPKTNTNSCKHHPSFRLLFSKLFSRWRINSLLIRIQPAAK
jgi:hypothetical protein